MQQLGVDIPTTGAMLGGVHRRTVLREIKRGNLESFRVGRRRMVLVKSIVAYVKRQVRNRAIGTPTKTADVASISKVATNTPSQEANGPTA